MRLLVCFTSLFATSAFAQPALVATPSSGEIGTIVRLEVVPPTPGYELTAETFGGWVGTYTSSGGTTPIFSVTYREHEVFVVDDWTAEVVLGSGEYTASATIDPTALANSGTLSGSFTLSTPQICIPDINQDGSLDFFDIPAFLAAFNNQDPIADLAPAFGSIDFLDVLAFLNLFNQGCGPSVINTGGPVSIGLNIAPAQWHMVYYPGGWAFGLEAQLLQSPAAQIGIFSASSLPSVALDDSLLGLTGVIYGIVLDVESNSLTAGGNPSVIRVDVLTVDGIGTEIDCIDGLELANEGVVDGRVRFSSRSLKNVLFTDTPIDDSGLTSLVTIHAVSNGTTFVTLNLGE